MAYLFNDDLSRCEFNSEFDTRFNNKFPNSFDTRFDSKFPTAFDTRFDTRFSAKFPSAFSTNLNNTLASMFKVKTFGTTDSISAYGEISVTKLGIAESGYTPIAIVAFGTNNAPAITIDFLNIWYYQGYNLQVTMSNKRSSSYSFEWFVRVLFIKGSIDNWGQIVS